MTGNKYRVSAAILLVVLLAAVIAAGLLLEQVPEGMVEVLADGGGEVLGVRGPGLHGPSRYASRRLYPLIPEEWQVQLRVQGAGHRSLDLGATLQASTDVAGAAAVWRHGGGAEWKESLRTILAQTLGELYGDSLGSDTWMRDPEAERRSFLKRGVTLSSLELQVEAIEERAAFRAHPGKVLLVGWDGADWSTIDRLIGEGRMPNLARLRNEGAWAELLAEPPLLSPILWTTAATGRRPLDHGILDFLVWDPAQERKVPITSRFRKAAAFWNLEGLRTTTIAWWGTWPAEAVEGALVTDRLAYSLFEDIPDAGDTALVWPPSLVEQALAWRTNPEDLPFEELSRYTAVAGASESADEEVKDKIRQLRKVIAAMETYHRIALELMRREQTPLFAVYYQGIDELGHLFGHLSPPLLDWVRPEMYRAFRGVVDAYYERQDEMLGELLSRADPETRLILISDHGFRTGDERPAENPADMAGRAALWHDREGIFLLSGPSVRPVHLEPVTLYDVLPTALYLLGVPLSREFTGTPQLLALEPGLRATLQVRWTDAYPTPEHGNVPSGPAPGERGMLAQLQALGYVGGEMSPPGRGDGGRQPAAGEKTALFHANRGGLLLQNGRYAEAVTAFEEAVKLGPGLPEAQRGLVAALGASGRLNEALERARRGAERFQGADSGFLLLAGALAVESGRVQEQVAWLEDRPKWSGTAEYETSLALLRGRMGGEQAEEQGLGRVLDTDPGYLPALEPQVARLLSGDRPAEAEALLRRAAAARPGQADILHLLGQSVRAQGRGGEALAIFEKAVGAEPDHPGYRVNLATSLAREGRLAEAERHLRTAYLQAPGMQAVLVNLGMVLAAQGKEEAIPFLEKASRNDPNSTRILNTLAMVHLAGGERETARDLLQASLDLDPDQDRVRELLEGIPEPSVR